MTYPFQRPISHPYCSNFNQVKKVKLQPFTQIGHTYQWNFVNQPTILSTLLQFKVDFGNICSLGFLGNQMALYF